MISLVKDLFGDLFDVLLKLPDLEFFYTEGSWPPLLDDKVVALLQQPKMREFCCPNLDEGPDRSKVVRCLIPTPRIAPTSELPSLFRFYQNSKTRGGSGAVPHLPLVSCTMA